MWFKPYLGVSRTTMKKGAKKAVAVQPEALDSGDEDDLSNILPLMFPKLGSSTIHTQHNHVFFNDEINNESAFALNKELRQVEAKMKILALTQGMTPGPIYLHLTTDGGSIHAAFSIVDCIQSLSVPVYSVVDGFVASAGTLISIACQKRYIRPNAYMLIHELRSGVWGKMSAIQEEVDNLKKLMDHLQSFYTKHTKLTKKQLDKLLSRDVIWNADECVQKGVVDSIYSS